MRLKTASGRTITKGIALGRPPGAITTEKVALQDVLLIACGQSAEKMIGVLIQHGLKDNLNDPVDIGIKWAESRGFVFESHAKELIGLFNKFSTKKKGAGQVRKKIMEIVQRALIASIKK